MKILYSHLKAYIFIYTACFVTYFPNLSNKYSKETPKYFASNNKLYIIVNFK